jgi:hypothetical protein
LRIAPFLRGADESEDVFRRNTGLLYLSLIVRARFSLIRSCSLTNGTAKSSTSCASTAALALGRNIASNDRVADGELGEELGHAVILDLALDLNHLVAGKQSID